MPRNLPRASDCARRAANVSASVPVPARYAAVASCTRWSAAGSALLWHQFEALFGGGAAGDAGDPSAPWRGAALVGAILIPVAMVAAMALKESFGSSLDWTEAADGSRTIPPDADGPQRA